MIKRLADTLACAAAACALLTAWLWWRSADRADLLAIFLAPDRTAAITSADGELLFMTSNVTLDPRRAGTALTLTVPPEDFTPLRRMLDDDDVTRHTLGPLTAGHAHNVMDQPNSWCAFVEVPHWLVLVLTAAIPALRLRKMWRARHPPAS